MEKKNNDEKKIQVWGRAEPVGKPVSASPVEPSVKVNVSAPITVSDLVSDPENPPPENPEKPLLSVAFDAIRHYLEQNHRFSFQEMDLAVEMLLAVLPEPERQWFREIAQQSQVPLWQVMLAQWRRCNENGLAPALILDPGWKPGELLPLKEVVCAACGETFKQKNYRDEVCSNRCGAEMERRKYGLPTREEQLAKLEPKKTEAEKTKNELWQQSHSVEAPQFSPKPN